MKKFILSVSVLPLLSIASAHAIDTECATFSRGYLFQFSHYNGGYAQDRALTQCRSHSSTLNSECEANIVCESGGFHRDDSCSTYSRGYLFEYSSEAPGFARNKVLTNCRSHSGTLNSECEANISCDLDRSYPAPHPGPGGGLPGPGPGGRLPGPGPGGRLPGPAPLPEIGSQLIGQWKASNCSYCFLQVSEYGGQLYGDMNPWDLNRSASNGAQPIVILSRDLLEYRGDTFRIERDRYSSRLRIVNTNTWSRNNVQSAELSSYAPAPIPQPIPAPVPPRRLVSCTMQKGSRIYRASAELRGEAISQILRQCAAEAHGYICRASDAVCTQY